MSNAPARPHVTINMAISADGKISTRRRESFPLGSAEDRRLMDVLRAQTDAVIIGARTAQLDGWAIRVRDRAMQRTRKTRRGTMHPLNVVLSTRLDLNPSRQLFTHTRTRRLVITTAAAPAARIRRFEKCAEVYVLRGKHIRPAAVLKVLADRGTKRVLLEGGGELNYSFFRARCVDEMYITVTPRILGGTAAPTAVDGEGFLRTSQVALQLVSSRRIGDEVFLRYRIQR